MSSVSLVPNATNSNTGALTGASVSAAWTDSSETTYVAYDYLENTEVALTNSTIPSGSVITYVILYAKATGVVGTSLLSSELVTGSNSQIAVTGIRASSPAPLVAVNAWDVSHLGLVDADIDALTAAIGDVSSTVDLIVYEANVLVVYYVKPTLTVDSPTGTLTAQNVVTVGWTPAYDGTPPSSSYEIKIFTDAVYGGGGFNPDSATSTLHYESSRSGTVGTSHAFTTPLVNDTYRAYVKLEDGRGTDDSAWAYTEFTINVTPPADPAMTLTAEPSSGRIKIDLADGVSATATVSYEVERSSPAGEWIPVRTGTGDLTETDITIYDYEAEVGVVSSYRGRAVAANGTVSGWDTDTVTYSPTSWWLKDPFTPSLNVAATMRSYPGASRTMRQDVKQALDRDDAVVISDTPGPWTGEITVRCVNGTARAALDALLDTADPLLLQGPLTQRDSDRWISVGAQDRQNIIPTFHTETWETLPWTEVVRPDGDLTE